MQEIGFIKFSFNISEGLFCLFSQSTEGLILIVTRIPFRVTTAVASDLILVELDGGQHSSFHMTMRQTPF